MAVISTMIVMTTLTKSSPAIRCGEPEDIMNGILERKCQVFINITNTIIIITTIIITPIVITMLSPSSSLIFRHLAAEFLMLVSLDTSYWGGLTGL